MASLPPESFLSMNSREPSRNQANREYSQLRMQERILGQILRIRDELVAPLTESIMQKIRNRTTQALGLVISEVEGGIRALKLLASGTSWLLRSRKASCKRSATVLALPPHRPWGL